MKGVLKVVAAALAGIVGLLFVTELLLHAFPSLLPIEIRTLGDNIGVAHPVLGSVFEPGSSGIIRTRDFAAPYQLDEHGFRNEGPWRPAFRAQAQASEQLFYPFDGHPNALGYRLIAQQVAAWLAADRQEDESG
ncbi:MAG: SGNH/GDSL hydrolase family protein [Gammaproteobacteria bacterium]|nr:SGNH/GDSL hydrolase family protein [Gammaproteobacteria bacterium]MBK8307470.1 SGNH/GDSL hydrolase family protein [Gammaproteobacteria bacterium]